MSHLIVSLLLGEMQKERDSIAWWRNEIADRDEFCAMARRCVADAEARIAEYEKALLKMGYGAKTEEKT